jgi:hypothetical protein
MRLLNITNPATITSLGVYVDPTGSVHTSWPLDDGIHLAITEETGGGHLKILNISNPAAITVADSDNPAPSTSSHNCHVQGNQLWVAWYTRGVRAYDISTPTNISEIGYFDTFPAAGSLYSGNWGVYPHLPSGVVAVSDISNGLFLVEYDADAGRLDGTVSSSAGGLLAGATVEYVNFGLDLTTDATGAYRFAVHSGAGHVVAASAFGHEPDTATVSVAPNGTTTTNFVLTKYPNGTLEGQITDSVSGLPIELVELSLAGTPLTATTDANGDYTFTGVPTQPGDTYQLHVLRYGYVVPAPISVTIVASSIVTRDLELDPGAQYEDFASPAGWSVQNDASTSTGFWVFGEPWGTYNSGVPFQTELDHTLNPENQCAVTGNAAVGGIGEDDVDGGATRLLSPVFNLSSLTEPHAFFYRWYAVNDAIDDWQVHATTDGGANWVLLESTPFHEPFWKGVDIDLTGFLSSFSAVQFRFTAEDPDPGQVVEAALDDFTIYDANGSAIGIALPHPAAMPLDLRQNFPNPFTGDTSIDFAIPQKGEVRLDVFDVRGARVATVVDEVLEPGPHRAVWDGRTFARKHAAAGVYFYELQAAGETRTRKMIRLE